MHRVFLRTAITAKSVFRNGVHDLLVSHSFSLKFFVNIRAEREVVLRFVAFRGGSKVMNELVLSGSQVRGIRCRVHCSSAVIHLAWGRPHSGGVWQFVGRLKDLQANISRLACLLLFLPSVCFFVAPTGVQSVWSAVKSSPRPWRFRSRRDRRTVPPLIEVDIPRGFH